MSQTNHARIGRAKAATSAVPWEHLLIKGSITGQCFVSGNYSFDACSSLNSSAYWLDELPNSASPRPVGSG
jgi:hypothetical protein